MDEREIEVLRQKGMWKSFFEGISTRAFTMQKAAENITKERCGLLPQHCATIEVLLGEIRQLYAAMSELSIEQGPSPIEQEPSPTISRTFTI